MAAEGTEATSRTQVRDYWRIAWTGKWIILVIALVVATLVAVATFLQTPIYLAKTRVEIQPRPKSINPATDFSQLGTSSWSWAAEERYLNTQMEIISSRAVAQAAIESLGLATSPRFSSLSDPAGWLARKVDVQLMLDTYILEISIEDTEPKMAQLLVNGIADAYIEANLEAAVANARRIIGELYTQIEPIKKAIAEKEKQRVDLARESAYFVAEAQESTLENRLTQLQNELTNVRIARGEREAIFNEIEELERRGEPYDALPQVATDPTIKDLKNQALRLEQETEELSLSYREEHPRIIAARTALADIPEKIEEQTAKIIANIKTEYAIDQRREVDLLNQLRLAREEGLSASQTSSQITTLDTEIKEDRRIYELINSRIKEIDLNQETITNNIRVIEEAMLPQFPVRPRRLFNIAAGIMLGLILGVGTVFFIDFLDNTIKSSEEVERYLNLPLLAMVPKYAEEMQPAAKESYQTLRTSILFASKGRSLKTALVTSAGPSEGKSRTVTHLAKTLAAAGDRVVLVDGDLRRPKVHSYLGLERSGGVTNYLLSEAAGDGWRDYLKDVPGVENLKVLTCGPLPPNPVELFGTERFTALLRGLRQHFDWVLIDSPPLATLSDSLVLGSLVDMTILVIKHYQNDRELIKRTTEQLRKVNANVIGAVLNAVDLKRAGYHDYYYKLYHYGRPDDQAPPVKTKKARRASRTASS